MDGLAVGDSVDIFVRWQGRSRAFELDMCVSAAAAPAIWNAARAAILGELRALWRRGVLLGVGRNIGRRLPRRRLQEPDGGRQAAGR